MSLHIIGIGLNDPKDITVKGLDAVKSAEIIYLEDYTSLLQCSLSDLEKFYDKKIILANREQSEQGSGKIVEEAKEKKVCFLVIGDALSATTHIDIYKQAKEAGVKVEIIHNASILTAVGITGLQLYNFGKTASIPYLDDFKELVAPYLVLEGNNKLGLHTLLLLDIKQEQKRFMTISEGLNVLEDIEKREGKGLITDDIFIIGCARIGSNDFIIRSGKLKEIKQIDFGTPLHCIIIPGRLHFLEKEMLEEHNTR
jgi:diphthine methyl ester synthase